MKKWTDLFIDEKDLDEIKINNSWENIDIPTIRDFLPYQYFDPATQIFINKNSLGFCIELSPQVGCDEILEKKLDTIFCRLPNKACVQVLMHASNKIGDSLNGYVAGSKLTNPVTNEISIRRSKYLAEKSRDYGFSSSIRNFRILISVSFNKDDAEIHNIDIEKVKNNFCSALESIPFVFSIMSPKDLINFVRDVFDVKNNIDSSNLDYNPLQVINEQIFTQEDSFVVLNNKVKDLSGNFNFKSFSVKQYPKHWSLSMSSAFIGDYFESNFSIKSPFLIHYAFQISEGSVSQALVEKSKANVFAKSFGRYFSKYIDRAREASMVNDYISEGGKYIYSNFQICLLGDNPTIDEAEQVITKMFASKKFILVEDKFISLIALLNLFPMSWGEGYKEILRFFGTTKKTIASEASKFLPILGEWKGTKTPAIPFVGRRGQLFYIWPFDNKGSGNFNINVTGKSGSGKSVLMQELITTVLARNGRVFVLDIGRSYSKLAHLLSGTFIEFNSAAKMVYNPFSNLSFNDEEEKNNVMTMIKSIVQVMIGAIGGVTDFESASLSQCLNEIWKIKGNEAKIDDLEQWFFSHKDQRIKDLGTRLYSFTTKGSYGRFFNQKSNIDFNDKFFVFELDEIKDNKELLPVVIQILMVQINSALLNGDRKTPTLIVVDEAWKALSNDQSAPFIESLARTTRKYEGSLVTGTQQISDFFTSAAANAAYANSDWKIYLAQDTSSYTEAKRDGGFKLSEDMERVLLSLHTKDGQYSEAMIQSQFGRVVGRLILDPYSSALYSTKSDEYSDVLSKMKKGLSIDDAIKSRLGEKIYA